MSFDSSDQSAGSTSSASISADSSSPPPRPPPPGSGSFLSCDGGGGGGGGEISMADLKFVMRLGRGDMGNVYLVEVKEGDDEDRRLMAAKVMDKEELDARGKQRRARTEKEILAMLDHPFVPKLHAFVETRRWYCLLTEFCPGGDLHLVRQRQRWRRFDEHAARFYAAEVVAALEYMHMLGIVYRDLKPENVLVRSDGHIMLTDFDLSIRCKDAAASTPHLISSGAGAGAGRRRGVSLSAAASPCIFPAFMLPAVRCFIPSDICHHRAGGGRRIAVGGGGSRYGIEFVAEPALRSQSFVGTHEYLAPEVVTGEGHGSSVDWWTLGIFIFELLYGSTPFKGEDNESTLANIVGRALEFPASGGGRDVPVVSSAAKELVAALLSKDPAKRLGSKTGAAAIKRHPFFEGVNWALLRREIPPYVPPPFKVDGRADDGDGAEVDFY